MKALILAAGRGERLGDHTDEDNKAALQLFGKPLVEYSIENALEAGVDEIVMVVGYMAESIINRFGIEVGGIRIRYVIQQERRGLVHAIECAKDAIDGDDFMLFLADEILWKPKHKEMLERFHEDNLFVACGVVREPNREEIRKTYALIEDDRDRRIYRLIEKPRNPPNNVRGTGNCILRSAIFDYIEYTPINQSRKEKELPDLIQCAIDDGQIVKAIDIGVGYVNINTPADIEVAESEYAERFGSAHGPGKE
ncbi:MAG: nucleotidyltransferase family protein [Deltaproteobacteria bacterium]|nr:nucleotidyltransferase family protein [Deltaproteobacteria bacterium]